MKFHTNIYAAVLLLFILSTACNKGLDGYQNAPGIYFFERVDGVIASRITSKSFSFVLYDNSKVSDTQRIKAKIMGLPVATDRSFMAAVDTGTKAVAGTEYKILPGVIKANEIIGYLPVVIYRTPDLKTVTKVLNLKIVDGGDFKAGVTEDARIQLNWTDNLVMPANWNTLPGLKTYFGVYSIVKYKFIIDVLGRSDFPIQTNNTLLPGQLTNANMLDLKAILKDALVVYNNTHSPVLTDETGQIVTFP
jgi:hypothetical protein